MSRLRCAFLVALLLGSIPAGVSAQVARVSGTIRDEAGKPVAGATITASSPDHAPSTLTASTDEKGRFAILGLRAGAWVFTVEAPGFLTARAAGRVQTVRANPAMNLTLRRGTPAPSGPTLDVTGAELQAIIDAAETAAAGGDLDAAVRGYEELLTKVPALTTAYLRLGALLERKGDAAAALDAYRKLLTLEPHDARASEAILRLTRIPE